MRDHNIFVTIAIPFYNSECFLADAIQSVVNQTYINWELLLMDDNGTDGSRKIAEKFAAKLSKSYSQPCTHSYNIGQLFSMAPNFPKRLAHICKLTNSKEIFRPR